MRSFALFWKPTEQSAANPHSGRIQPGCPRSADAWTATCLPSMIGEPLAKAHRPA
ncbi:MAG: hypothetical protein ACYTHK_08080 [Planctomycetota bacterium]